MNNYIVSISGASGMVYAKRLIDVLLENNCHIELCITDMAKFIMKEELGINPKALSDTRYLSSLFGEMSHNVRFHDIHDLTAPIASGSYKTKGMIVVPCSMNTLSALAVGRSENLLERAADVTLKEGRQLIIIPRETPFTAIHLENMLKLTHAGAAVIPPIPAFYHDPQSIDDLINYVITKILDRMGVDTNIMNRWDGVKNKGTIKTNISQAPNG
ncbi:MAG: flavin prenyltransferase UbiX [Candidatus Ancaeobacter aquaticus]|nr:flavin prenyltransferase UbiX [Candidatus Ancaeobacter aquaticus]